MLVVLLLAGAPILFGERARATEQAIVPLTPAQEQQVVPIGPAGGQVVQGATASQEQAIGPKDPPSESEKAASTAGKVTIGVLAAVVSMAAMAAQLLLL